MTAAAKRIQRTSSQRSYPVSGSLKPQRRLAPRPQLSFRYQTRICDRNVTTAEASLHAIGLEDAQGTNVGEEGRIRFCCLSGAAKSHRVANAQRRHRHSESNILRRDGDRFVQSAFGDDRTAFRAAGRKDFLLQHRGVTVRFSPLLRPILEIHGADFNIERFRGTRQFDVRQRCMPQLQTLPVLNIFLERRRRAWRVPYRRDTRRPQ